MDGKTILKDWQKFMDRNSITTMYLGFTLKVKALKIYVSLPDEILSGHGKLREALLKVYSVDAHF